jgi:hypothetical protein
MLNFIYNIYIFVWILPVFSFFITFMLLNNQNLKHMKKFFTLLMMMIWISYISYGQIVITEISYNPPEAGTDSLEYFEIFNAGNTPINLKDYKVSRGVELTFPEVVFNPGSYLILSVKESAFRNNYGKSSIQWTAGALNNAGEVLAISDPSGVEIVAVDFKDVPPWPGLADGTDGDGRSIELCDLLADQNNGANWKVSQKNLGFQINGKQIYGTPGEANSIVNCNGAPTEYPLRSIVSVTTTNADGVADSIGVNCTLKGIVYGVNLRPTGYQFTIIDAQNNGIGVFLDAGNLNYTVKEGDEVEVKGAITQFNGFTQIVLVDIKSVSQNNTLVNPKAIDSFEEEDESSLVTLGYVSFVDPTQWIGTGSGFNMTMVNGSGQEFNIRIDNDIDAYSAPVPTAGTFFVTGLLGQFDNSVPYTEGYQLLPRYLVDFDPAGSTDNILDANMKIQPNPTTHILTIITDSQPERLELYDIKGQKLAQFTNTLSVDMSIYSNGVYIVKAVKGDKSTTLRVIKM